MVSPQNFPKSKGEPMKTCPQCDTGYPDSHTTCPTHGVLLNEIRDLKPGMVIHKTYRIVRKLGQGGMGTVYLAQHIHMGEQRALKFLSPELSRDQGLTNRFLREVRTLRQVHSRNVVECGDLEAAEDDSLFFSMEFVDGPDLRAFLHDAPQPFDVDLALSITRSIAEGLGAAHSKGMVHRDIKPENILMARNGNAWLPKIADFGIVATKENSSVYTKTGGTLLTMAYAAPEQWHGTPAAELDGRTDLYALGGLLYEMLTGQSPFHAENYEGWAEQHRNTPPQPPSTLRPDLANWQGLDALTLRLLAKDRNDRPKDVAEVLGLLDSVRSTTSASHQETVIEDGGIRSRRIPIWVWATSIVVLVMAVITVGLAVSLPTSVITTLGLKFDRPYRHTFAIPFYRFACARGDSNACYNAGDDYESTPAGKPANVIAIVYLSKACDMGNAKGCSSLGEDYYYGSCVTKDYSRAEALYSKACEMGDAKGCEGLNDLGFDYELGSRVGQDISRAEALYSKTCEKGNNEGCKGLVGIGLNYEIGSYVKKDPLHAALLYSKACDAGIADGCGDLGNLYLDGNGLKQDFHSAMAFISKACNGGDAGGCWDEGQIYLNGWGLAKNKEKAKDYFKKGCTMGLKIACDDERNPKALPLK
jgi:serine/threonine protein kinase/TPR repeat protein